MPSEIEKRFDKLKFKVTAKTPTHHHINGELTPEVIEALVKLKDMIIAEDVMEESDRVSWLSLEIPITYEKFFLEALEEAHCQSSSS